MADDQQGFFHRIDPEGRMTFMQHLMELRNRIMVAAGALFVLVMLALVFYRPIFDFLKQPIDNVNARFREDEELCRMIVNVRLDPSLRRKLDGAGVSDDLRNRIYDAFRDPKLWEKVKSDELGPELRAELMAARVDLGTPVVTTISTDPLSTTLILMSVAFWVAVVLGSPVLVYEVWAFVSPGLKPREKAAIRPVLVGGIFFFALGAAACYYLIFPLSMSFFVWLDLDMGYLPNYTPDSYINLLITFMLITGLIFEIPMVVA
ncbi:MAG: twin-arginine translocase subunit TatC, partial [Planctomycetota bacterium]|nr:twin-arginine translocase subunit TatC [Planctomycetota bacterium]